MAGLLSNKGKRDDISVKLIFQIDGSRWVASKKSLRLISLPARLWAVSQTCIIPEVSVAGKHSCLERLWLRSFSYYYVEGE